MTAYDQYAVEAFRLEAMDYLLKPVDEGRLAETIDRARRMIQEPKPVEPPRSKRRRPGAKLLVRSNNRNLIVDANDVIYATIDNGLITLVATSLEGHSNYRTIEESAGQSGPRDVLAGASVVPGEHQPDQRGGAVVQIQLPGYGWTTGHTRRCR